MNTLSVITVTYNAEKTLQRTLKSVAGQTYPFIEHVIVDGASTDGTVQLIQEHEGEGVRWISEPDKGLYDAMNKAMGMATGDWLCFLNAGDTFHETKTVEKLMRSFTPAEAPDILYGETAIVDDEGKFLGMRRLKTPDRLTWKSFKQGMVVCHQAFIVKRELAEPYDLTYRFSSDFDWAIRLMKRANTIHNSRLLLIDYLNEGLSTTNHQASLKERYRIMAKHYGHLSTFFYHLWFVVRAVIVK